MYIYFCHSKDKKKIGCFKEEKEIRTNLFELQDITGLQGQISR